MSGLRVIRNSGRFATCQGERLSGGAFFSRAVGTLADLLDMGGFNDGVAIAIAQIYFSPQPISTQCCEKGTPPPERAVLKSASASKARLHRVITELDPVSNFWSEIEDT
jgi:hypothetical protein